MHAVHVIKSGRQLRSDDPMTRRLSAPQIADDIRDRIRSGEYPPGSKLPSYPQLAEIYSVHPATIQRAMTILRTRGDVYGQQGRGVFVPEPN